MPAVTLPSLPVRSKYSEKDRVIVISFQPKKTAVRKCSTCSGVYSRNLPWSNLSTPFTDQYPGRGQVMFCAVETFLSKTFLRMTKPTDDWRLFTHSSAGGAIVNRR